MSILQLICGVTTIEIWLQLLTKTGLKRHQENVNGNETSVPNIYAANDSIQNQNDMILAMMPSGRTNANKRQNHR